MSTLFKEPKAIQGDKESSLLKCLRHKGFSIENAKEVIDYMSFGINRTEAESMVMG